MEIVKYVDGRYENEDAVNNVINYIFDLNKTDGYIGAFNVSSNPEECIQQMKALKSFYSNDDKRQLVHVIVSSEDFNYISWLERHQIGKKIAEFYAPRYQVFYGVHEPDSDSNCYHIHFAINSVSYIDGRKVRNDMHEQESFKKHVTNVLHEYLSDAEIYKAYMER